MFMRNQRKVLFRVRKMHLKPSRVFVISIVCSSGLKDSRKIRSQATRDCKDKFKVIENHSACTARSGEMQSAGVSNVDIMEILKEHNRYRGNVTPPATNMLKMSWDTEVALVAQAWAETCSFSHDENQNRNIPGRLSAGQNIGKGYQSWSAVIKAWYDEVKDFTYNSTNDFEKVGHYTQVVWAESNKIGCGMADCGTYNFHVCNYSPAGNIDINVPYKTGIRCGSCNQTCEDGLCDCGTTVCENGGTLDPDTCDCSCKWTFHVGKQCKLDCRNLTEPYMCGSGSYNKAGCVRYSSTVPFDCPNTCGVCPAGGFTYTEGTGEGNGSNGNGVHFVQPVPMNVLAQLSLLYLVLYF